MQLEIKHLQQQLGLTVLYVTHDQSEALIMSDVIIVMNQGTIEQYGAPDDIYSAPNTKFVADFIGETNIIKGVVKEILDKSCRVVGDDINIVARCQSIPMVGQEVYLAVRPERTQICLLNKKQENGIIGIIDEIIYLGEIIKYIVKSMHNAAIISKQLNNGKDKAFEKGDEVCVYWNSDDCIVINS